MKPNDFLKPRVLLVALSLLLALRAGAAQFVELTAEVQGDDWDYNLLVDRLNEKDRGPVTGLFQPSRTIRCVVGTNMWMIEDTNRDYVEQRWFTGTKYVVNSFWIDARGQKKSGPDAPVSIHIHDSVDGNPGRPGGVPDLMIGDIGAKFCWMAFCSAPTLKHEGRTIYPTSDLWKESSIYFTGWKDKTTTFPDELGLPQSIDLVTTNRQQVFEYQAHLTTNFMGWSFPKEFYCVQYTGSSSNGWRVHLTMKGRITSIHEGTEPKVPDEVLKAARQ
jgi:hypothetical protein